jgi:predicted Zn-dependent protease
MNRKLLRPFLLGSAIALASCTTNPTTGRSQFNALSRDQEIQMGTEATPQITKQYGGPVKNAAVQQYVSELGHKLAAQTEKDNPKLPWEFTLLDSDVINAFSLPGGKVFFSRGLAVKLQNEAQMAGVLGHEIGHVTARHINDQMTHEAEVGLAAGLAQALLEGHTGGGAAGAAVGQLAPQVIQVGGQSVLLRFSRKQETEADALGMRYMTKAGYNPKAMLGVMEVLQQAMQGNTTPEFFSTHPYPDTRIKSITAALNKQYASVVNDPKYVLNEAQYQQRFLKPMSGHAQAFPKYDAALAEAGLGDPVLWCAHCREAALRAAAASGGN